MEEIPPSPEFDPLTVQPVPNLDSGKGRTMFPCLKRPDQLLGPTTLLFSVEQGLYPRVDHGPFYSVVGNNEWSSATTTCAFYCIYPGATRYVRSHWQFLGSCSNVVTALRCIAMRVYFVLLCCVCR